MNARRRTDRWNVTGRDGPTALTIESEIDVAELLTCAYGGDLRALIDRYLLPGSDIDDQHAVLAALSASDVCSP